VRDVESTTIEKLGPYVVTTSSDPSGDPPEFSATTTLGDPTTWVEGEWTGGAWSPTDGEIRALSPLAGDGQALDLNPGTRPYLYVRWTVGIETPVRLLEQINVT
jgi:hypothetical protein